VPHPAHRLMAPSTKLRTRTYEVPVHPNRESKLPNPDSHRTHTAYGPHPTLHIVRTTCPASHNIRWTFPLPEILFPRLAPHLRVGRRMLCPTRMVRSNQWQASWAWFPLPTPRNSPTLEHKPHVIQFAIDKTARNPLRCIPMCLPTNTLTIYGPETQSTMGRNLLLYQFVSCAASIHGNEPKIRM
jgi:hypothetical protein